MSSRSQRFGPRGSRAMVRPVDIAAMTPADCRANLYTVRYHGEMTVREEVVLAADEEQAKVHGVLRWRSLGVVLPPNPTVSAELRQFSSGEMRAAVLSFESEAERELRNGKPGTAA